MAEGSCNRGKNRSARYHTSLGSLREVLACFEVAAAMGYLPGVEPALRARFDHVLGTSFVSSAATEGLLPPTAGARGRGGRG
jgi:hypothetical protein